MCANPLPFHFVKSRSCAGSGACADCTIYAWSTSSTCLLYIADHTQSLSFNCCYCAWSALLSCHLTRHRSLYFKEPQLCMVQPVQAMKSVYTDPTLAVLSISVTRDSHPQQRHWIYVASCAPSYPWVCCSRDCCSIRTAMAIQCTAKMGQM